MQSILCYLKQGTICHKRSIAMGKKLRYAALVLVGLLLLMSGTLAHNIYGLSLDHASRHCLQIGEHAVCVSEIKH